MPTRGATPSRPGNVTPPAFSALRRPSTWLALLVVLAVLAAFFWRALPGSVQFLELDTGRAHEPMKRFIADEIAHGRLAAWNPFSGLGTPLVSGAIDAVLHPFNLLLLLPFELGFKLWVLLSYVLGAVGTWAWARGLGRGSAASVGAGLAFATSGFLVGQSNNVTYLTAYASAPWVFAAARFWFERGTPGALALVGLAAAVLAAAGDPQAWGIALLLIPVLGPGDSRGPGHPWMEGLRRAGLALLAAALASAPFILPVVAWLPHSERAVPQSLPETLQKWNLHPSRIAEMAVPHLFRGDPGETVNLVFTTFAGNQWTAYPWVASVYVGAACLALAVAGSAASPFARRLVGASVLAIWAATGPFLGFWDLAGHLPVLSGFRYWEKLAVWPALFLAVAAAYGVDSVATSTRAARRLGLGTAVAGAIAVLLGIVLWRVPGPAALWLAGSRPVAAGEMLASNARAGLLHAGATWILIAVAAAMVASGRAVGLATLALPCLLVLDPFLANRDLYVVSASDLGREGPLARMLRERPGHDRILLPFAPVRDRWPRLSEKDNLTRWWARTLEFPWNVPSRIGNLRSYAGMRQDRMHAYEAATSFVPRIGAGIWGFSSILVPDRPPSIGSLPVPPPYRIVAFDDDLPASLVEIPHRPRAYLAESVASTDLRGALGFVLDERAVGSGLVVIEGAVSGDGSRPAGTVRIREDVPGRTVLDVLTDRRALLVLNDAYAPGWRTSVDGARVEMVAANLLARGVWLEAGSHRVVFEYETPMLAAGWAAAGAGLAAILAWAVARRARRPGHPPLRSGAA